jgi:hypothetical protein
VASTAGPDPLGQRAEQTGQHGVGIGVVAHGRRTGREEVEVLRATDGAAVHGFDVDEARLAEPVEVEPDGVGVDAERLGKILRRQSRGRPGELLIHGVPGLVAQRLEHCELVDGFGHRD